MLGSTSPAGRGMPGGVAGPLWISREPTVDFETEDQQVPGTYSGPAETLQSASRV